MVASKSLTLSPTSSFATFRPSPLNPQSISNDKSSVIPPKRSSSFPASRPLRPFPSVARSITNPVPGAGVHVREDGCLPKHGGESSVKKPPKTIEISSKWKGGFFVLGMTQAEFSRKD
ncbi:hypothetical protein K439DRAFT_1325333 [Ramaria rubella]|nr:hypothetical protein K439DRAFT_1325333 [Ramaria rubella]